MTNITHLERVASAASFLVETKGLSAPAAVIQLRKPDAWGHTFEGAIKTPVALVVSVVRAGM
ncbi:MAG: hypothetical protein EBU83_05940 [bacterium]|jgi:hypothetical protein|nr:hypothetical protein [Candidatus Aquidulcis sp.]